MIPTWTLNGVADRRKLSRIKLRLPVRLIPGGDSPPIETETVDISRDGFYCFTDHPFEPGTQIRCILVLSMARPAGSGQVRLEGTAEVIRITLSHSRKGFGIGCCLRDYRLVNSCKEEIEMNSKARLM